MCNYTYSLYNTRVYGKLWNLRGDAECRCLLGRCRRYFIWSLERVKKKKIQMILTFNIAYFISIQYSVVRRKKILREWCWMKHLFTFQLSHMWFFNYYLGRFTCSIRDYMLFFMWIFNWKSKMITITRMQNRSSFWMIVLWFHQWFEFKWLIWNMHGSNFYLFTYFNYLNLSTYRINSNVWRY